MSTPTSSSAVQLFTSRATIDLLSQAAAEASIEVRPVTVTVSDQRLGIAEIAAILALVKTAAEIAKLLIEAYKKAREPQKVIVKTPVSSITLEIDGKVTVEAVVQKLKEVGIS
ncbi:MAG: hypothetical protein HZC37_01655 [Burkholderiales bacterium]|nr:hypothetical protein [Burkholderiales bacterium]